MSYEIRTFGDPVLKAKASEVVEIDGKLARLADEMVGIMYDAPGIGLAAPQIGVQKQFFVYDLGDGPATLINPVITDSSGEWVYDEGCLSIPGLYVEIMRPKEIHVVGYDLDGNEVSLEADELLSRVIQHELDHLHGVLMFDRLEGDQKKEAMREYRRLLENPPAAEPPKRRRLRLS